MTCSSVSVLLGQTLVSVQLRIGCIPSTAIASYVITLPCQVSVQFLIAANHRGFLAKHHSSGRSRLLICCQGDVIHPSLVGACQA